MKYTVTQEHGAPTPLHGDGAVQFLMEQHNSAVTPENAAHDLRRFHDWLALNERPVNTPPDENWYVEVDAGVTKSGSSVMLEFYNHGDEDDDDDQ